MTPSPVVRHLPGLVATLAFVALIVLGARVDVAVPGSPVPQSLQTLAVLAALKLISRSVPERTVVDVEVRWARDARDTARAVETALTVGDTGLKRTRLKLTEDGQICRQSWRLTVRSRDLAALAERIRSVPGVTGFDLAPRDD